MANEPRSSDTDKQTGGVTIGTIIGGIHNSIIAGRDVITNVFTGADEQRAQRNRRAMLELVRNTWVKGVLEQSLHGAAMIELGLEERADAVEHPWDMVLQRPDQPNRPLPAGTKIVDIFDEMNRALLILGEPGSGKTTMLLKLARDTIAHAEEDPTQPIPVVFNLSSWAEKRQSIAEWLVDELNVKYNIPKKIARPWVENGDLLLLLDGLDEVKLEHQEACVEAINDFRQKHMMPLVVCSRVADYEALTTRLRLQGAVLLQPLTPQQVDQYLEGAGTELLAVRRTLQHDPTLQELAQTPLMLSVMSLAYRGMSVQDLQSLDMTEARRRHVLDTYVQRMFQWRRADRPYSPQQIVHRLTWLAQKMSQHAQTVFLIERMQPSWLTTRTQLWAYAVVSRLIGGLGVGLSVGLIVGLSAVLIGSVLFPADWWLFELIGGLSVGPIGGVIGGLVVGLIDALRLVRSGKDIAIKKAPTRWQSALSVLGVGLILGLLFGLIGGGVGGAVGILISRLSYELSGEALSSFEVFVGAVGGVFGAAIGGAVGGLIFGLIFGLRGSKQTLVNDVQTVEALTWSRSRSLRGGASGLFGGGVVGLMVGLILGFISVVIFVLVGFVGIADAEGLFARLFGGLFFGLVVGLIFGLILGLILGLISGLVGTLIGGLSSGIVEAKTFPNQGIQLSVRNAVLTGLLFGLSAGVVVWLTLWLFFGLFLGPSVGPIYGLGGGLSAGLLAALWYGGLDTIQHLILRFILYRNGYIPWNYARFLDYAAERIFLRKVGGGYIFIHRLLQDYFASLYQGQ